MKRVGISMTALCLLAALVVGCSGSGKPSVTVAAGVASIGQPSPVTVTGLSSQRSVTVTITSTDDRGARWRLSTELRADGDGRLSFDAGELIAKMTPLDPATVGLYSWGERNDAFHLTVDGATATVLRRMAPHPIRSVAVAAEGLVGTFYTADLPGRHSAVLMIGGSEGGQPPAPVPSVLAGYGHPVLTLAYFKAPGRPKTLSNIPLEYFATALHWLARQPGVDPSRLVVDGASRGGEGALLIAATYPDLVHGVIAGVPSNVALCNPGGCSTAAWTLHGRPVPYTKQVNNPSPTDNPQAVIKVEKIDGPVLLNCGGLDQVWDSCPYARAVMSRLHGSHFPDQLQACALCDHFVGRGLPDDPYARTDPTRLYDQDISAYPKFFAAVMSMLGA